MQDNHFTLTFCHFLFFFQRSFFLSASAFAHDDGVHGVLAVPSLRSRHWETVWWSLTLVKIKTFPHDIYDWISNLLIYAIWALYFCNKRIIQSECIRNCAFEMRAIYHSVYRHGKRLTLFNAELQKKILYKKCTSYREWDQTEFVKRNICRLYYTQTDELYNVQIVWIQSDFFMQHIDKKLKQSFITKLSCPMQ